MTRRIVHPNCTTIPTTDKLEWIIRKVGLAWSDFSCDLCGEYIFLGERCIAESYGTKEDYYQPWEDQFIKEIKE